MDTGTSLASPGSAHVDHGDYWTFCEAARNKDITPVELLNDLFCRREPLGDKMEETLLHRLQNRQVPVWALAMAEQILRGEKLPYRKYARPPVKSLITHSAAPKKVVLSSPASIIPPPPPRRPAEDSPEPPKKESVLGMSSGAQRLYDALGSDIRQKVEACLRIREESKDSQGWYVQQGFPHRLTELFALRHVDRGAIISIFFERYVARERVVVACKLIATYMSEEEVGNLLRSGCTIGRLVELASDRKKISKDEAGLLIN